MIQTPRHFIVKIQIFKSEEIIVKVTKEIICILTTIPFREDLAAALNDKEKGLTSLEEKDNSQFIIFMQLNLQVKLGVGWRNLRTKITESLQTYKHSLEDLVGDKSFSVTVKTKFKKPGHKLNKKYSNICMITFYNNIKD